MKKIMLAFLLIIGCISFVAAQDSDSTIVEEDDVVTPKKYDRYWDNPHSLQDLKRLLKVDSTDIDESCLVSGRFNDYEYKRLFYFIFRNKTKNTTFLITADTSTIVEKKILKKNKIFSYIKTHTFSKTLLEKQLKKKKNRYKSIHSKLPLGFCIMSYSLIRKGNIYPLPVLMAWFQVSEAKIFKNEVHLTHLIYNTLKENLPPESTKSL